MTHYPKGPYLREVSITRYAGQVLLWEVTLRQILWGEPSEIIVNVFHESLTQAMSEALDGGELHDGLVEIS